MIGYGSYDALVLDVASFMKYGIKELPPAEGLTGEERAFLTEAAKAAILGTEPEGTVYDTAHISYVHAGTLWKKLIRDGAHETIDRAADLTAAVMARTASEQGIGPDTACERFDRFYSDLFKRKEDLLSREFDDHDFTAMDLGLDPWYVLDEDMKERYGRSRMKEAAVQNDILERSVPKTVSAMKEILLSYPGKDEHIFDMLLTELLYDALRTARTGEEAKAEAFIALASLSGSQYIRNDRTWYEIRDNRSTFAADAFLLIHDGKDEDRLFKDMLAEDLASSGRPVRFKEFLLLTERLLSLCEAYALSEKGHLPGGFSSKEYMKKLTERLVRCI